MLTDRSKCSLVTWTILITFQLPTLPLFLPHQAHLFHQSKASSPHSPAHKPVTVGQHMRNHCGYLLPDPEGPARPGHLPPGLTLSPLFVPALRPLFPQPPQQAQAWSGKSLHLLFPHVAVLPDGYRAIWSGLTAHPTTLIKCHCFSSCHFLQLL